MFTFHIHYDHDPEVDAKLDKILNHIKEIERKQGIIIMKLSEAIQVLADENVKLDDIGAKLTEGFAEITDLIGQLQDTTLTPEQQVIVDALKAKVDAVQPQAQQIADIVPNPPPPAP